jgi:Lon protease-like protein
MLPSTIPIFPLPNVVLFPNVFLPLHIFEPRYRAMVNDALNGDRIIGMVLLRPGYEANYEGRPSIYDIGTAGVITHAEPLDDGRFNIVLRGVERFRVLEENASKPYRLASILSLPEAITAEDRVELGRHRNRLQALLAVAMERAGSEPRFPPAVADEDLVNALAQYIELEPMERQALLEQHGVLKRCRALVELLEMRTFAKRDSWKGGSVH